MEQAAEEKQKIHVRMKEADERVKEMSSTITALKVRDAYMHDLVLTLQRTSILSIARSVFKCKIQKSETSRLSLHHIRYN